MSHEKAKAYLESKEYILNDILDVMKKRGVEI